MKAFVTGASGFIGHYLVRELLSRGYEVSGLVRGKRDISDLENIGMSKVTGDIIDGESLVAPVADSDVVFHLAAVLMPGDWQAYAQGVIGTENVLRAARKAQTGRVVLMSSIAVYAAPAPGKWLREDSPLKKADDSDFYSRQKVLQERVAWSSMESKELDITIVRSPTVVGVGDPRLLPTLTAMKESSLRDLADTDRLHLPFVSVTSLAKGLVEASLSAEAVGNVYNLAHAAPVTRGDFFRQMDSTMPAHRSSRKKRLALSALCLAIRTAEMALTPLGRQTAARPRTEAVRLLEKRSGESASVDWMVDSSKAKAHFGWSDDSDYRDLIYEIAAATP